MRSIALILVVGLQLCSQLMAENCKSTGLRCITSCSGLPDGDYQSCHGCTVYASCVGGVITDDRQCAPGGTVWDDRKKRCEWTSRTCRECAGPGNPGSGWPSWPSWPSWPTCVSTGRSCIRSCDGRPDGDYQSCKECDVYASCSGGVLYDNRPCAPGGTVWDDRAKLCDWDTRTCRCDRLPIITRRPIGVRTTTTTPAPPGSETSQPAVCSSTGSACITSCDGRVDGDYQSCKGCAVYATCSHGILHDDRPCAPGGTVWDDGTKRCEWSSTTCTGCSNNTPVPPSGSVTTRPPTPSPPACSSTGSACITSCDGRGDGDYQSCKGCAVYASCSHGTLYDDRPCAPGGTYWDDLVKRCEWSSTTCTGCTDNNPPTQIPPSCATKNTGPSCIKSCDGKDNGDYQSCNGCYVYASCSNGVFYDNRPCAPGGTVWDDSSNRCEWSSTTCNCV